MSTPERWVEVAGRMARYRESGSGAAVIIVPGLGLRSRFYQPVLARLAAAGFRAIAPDLPGFGQAHGRFTGTNVDEGAAWLIEFANAVGAEQPAWIGHSISCQIVLAIADQAPDRAHAIILAAPTGASGHRKFRQALALARVAITESPRVLLSVTRDYSRSNPIQYIGSWVRAADDKPLDRAPRIALPTLILVGTRDPVPTAEFIGELAARLPHVVVATIQGGNHALPLDRPDAFSARAADFLKAVLRERTPGR